MKWPWSRRAPTAEQDELDRRLDRINKDDVKVDELSVRVRKILRENNLAPAIMKALRVRQ